MAQGTTLSSATGLLAVLEPREDDAIKVHALKQINMVVDQFWHEIADSIELVTGLSERADFSCCKLASLVASKVYYYLGEWQQSMKFALGSEELFDIASQNEFVQTLIVVCIDTYTDLRRDVYNGADVVVDARLENVVERMLHRCIEAGEHRHAIAVSLQVFRLDRLEEAIRLAAEDDWISLLNYTFNLALGANPFAYRREILLLVARLTAELAPTEIVQLCKCLMFLEDADALAAQLIAMVRASKRDVLMAYQIALQIADNGTSELIHELCQRLRAESEAMAKMAAVIRVEDIQTHSTDAHAAPDEPQDGAAVLEPVRPPPLLEMRHLDWILTNEVHLQRQLEFLYHAMHPDHNLLRLIMSSFDPRRSILHMATVSANALMHAGTTCDKFLRENLDWIRMATKWTKFSMTAGLGVIHLGHLRQSIKVLEPYLPRGELQQNASLHIEGGSLYALGLIHAHHVNSSPEFDRWCRDACNATGRLPEGWDLKPEVQPSRPSAFNSYLLYHLTQHPTNAHPVVHGAALGLGISALGTADERIFDKLFVAISTCDDASTGEALGYALGLVSCGHPNDRMNDMLVTVHETRHDKIARGLVMGVAFMHYGQDYQADPLIKNMLADKEAIVRYGATFLVGMAYAGTGRSTALHYLLHVAASDLSDDVRRAAVMNLGFVLCMSPPDQVFRFVSLLINSYIPAVRYGACLALGIGCAGNATREAVKVVTAMMRDDPVDTVRQGAMIGLAMMLIQSTGPHVNAFQRSLREYVEDKHESSVVKFGATLAAGIVDAGGRNVTISLRTRAGYKNRTAIVGMAMFVNYWYWYPLVHFIALSFVPSALIALDADLNMPQVSFRCAAPASWFAYPPDVTIDPKLPLSTFSKVELAAARRNAQIRRRRKTESLAIGGTVAATGSGTAISESTPKGDVTVKVSEIKVSETNVSETNMSETNMSETNMSETNMSETNMSETKEPTTITLNERPQKDQTPPSTEAPEDQTTTLTTPTEAAPLHEPASVLLNPARVLRNQFKYVSMDPTSKLQPVLGDVSYGIFMVHDPNPDPFAEPVATLAGFDAIGRYDDAQDMPMEAFQFAATDEGSATK